MAESSGPATFTETWQHAVARHSHRTFLLFSGEDATTSWTYAEFDQIVARVAGTLRMHGVGPGSPVHLVLRSSPAFVALWLAVARLGAWMVPVDPASAARDIASQVGRVRPVVGIAAAARAEVYREGALSAGHKTLRVLEVSEDASDVQPGGALVSVGEPVTRSHLGDPRDPLAVMFTSGTTSKPKGVELTQACYANVARVMAGTVDLAPQHRWLVTLPMFHANAQYYCFSPAIEVGASVALTASFSASRWVSQARELEATHASLFAAPIRMILARCPEDEQPLTLQHVWFAQNLGSGHHRAFGDLAGTLPRQLYGMTETVAVVTADRNDPPVHNLIGPPVAGRGIRVVDLASGDEVTASGVPGELQVHGCRGKDLFAGYLDAPEINSRSFIPDTNSGTGGTWFRTGDLVAVEPDGESLRFVGRVDDVIKVSGENVSLTEVEAAVAQAPGVLEAAVVAQPDPIRDQVPVAYVVANNKAAPPNEADLQAWATLNLAPAARPRAWHLIDELPRTSVVKIRRFRIADAGEQS